MPGFTTPDPLAEMHYNESPYSYCGNNPVNRVDLSGMDYINPNPDSDPDDNNDDVYSSFPDPGNATNSDGTRFYYHLGDVSKTPDEDNCVSIIPSSGSYEAYYNMFCPQGQYNSGTGGNNIVGDRTYSNSVRGASSTGSVINNVTNVVGKIDFSHSLLTDNSLGTKISLLNTGLTGYQVYDQFTKGGISNINPVDATSASISTISLIAKGVSSLGLGGSTIALISEGATFGGYAVAVYQSWYLIYKPMNDMNFAPSYINNDGEPPVYGDPTKDPY